MKIISTFAFALLMFVAACGGPAHFVLQGTSLSRGTDGELTVEFDQSNHRMLLELEHLPPPSRITEDGVAYLVWVQQTDGRPSLLGRLAYDPEERTGRLEATTAYDSFTVMVTVEVEEGPAEPSDNVVMQQVVVQ